MTIHVSGEALSHPVEPPHHKTGLCKNRCNAVAERNCVSEVSAVNSNRAIPPLVCDDRIEHDFAVTCLWSWFVDVNRVGFSPAIHV